MSRLAWALVALFSATGAFGFWLNDEADQAAALHSLAHGSLRVEGNPDETYSLGNDIVWKRRWDDSPVASMPLNFLALAVIPLVLVAHQVAPLGTLVAGAFTVAVWKAVPLRWPWQAMGLDRFICWAALLGLFSAAAAGFRRTGPDAEFFFAIIALQATNLALAGLATWLLWRILGTVVEATPGRTVALLATIGGSWLFWAKSLKYHMATALLVVALIWLLLQKPDRKRNLGIGALLGLTVWVNVGAGAVVLLAMGMVELARAWHGRHRLGVVLQRWSLLAVGALFAMLPMFALNQHLYGNPFFDFYFAGSAPGADSGLTDTISGSASTMFDVLAGIIRWQGVESHVRVLASTLTTGRLVEGAPLGIFLITPFLALSVLGLVALRRRAARSAASAFAVAILLAQTILMTKAAAVQGDGYDARLWFHTLPAFAFLATLGARVFLQRVTWQDIRSSLGLALVVVFASLLLLRALTAHGIQFDNGGRLHGQAVVLAIDAFLVLGGLFWAAFQLSRRQGASALRIPVIMAFVVAPLVWSFMFLVIGHSGLPDHMDQEGAAMFVPGMDRVSSALRDIVFAKSPTPFVFDGNGTLVFHPDFGRCDIPPYPCPEGIEPNTVLAHKLAAARRGNWTAL